MTWIDTPYIKIRLESGPRKFTAVVSKKVHRHAVVRHRYQRLLREAYHALPEATKQKYDMVWVAKPTILDVNKLQELWSSLEPHLKQLK